MTIDLNQIVRVRLSQHGADIHNKYYEDIPARHRPVQLQRGDMITTMMWEIMSIFGPHISHGSVPTFEPNKIETDF